MDNPVGICNVALTLLGASKIRSLEENTDAARKCNGVFWGCVKSMLQDYKWSFATVQLELAQIPTEFAGWPYAYRCPSDCLDIVSMINPNINEDWHYPVEASDFTIQIEDESNSDVLLTIHDRIILKYVMYHENVAKYSAKFREALVRKLVIALGVDLKGISVSELDAHERVYQMLLSQAKAKDARRTYIKSKIDNKYKRGRR